MKRKIISAILALAMLVSMFPVSTFAGESDPYLMNDRFDYDTSAAIGSSATSTMPWYKYSATLTNFKPEIMKENGNGFLAAKIEPGSTSTSHQRLFAKFADTGVEGVVTFSFDVRLPKNAINADGSTFGNGTTDISILDSGINGYIASFRLTRSGDKVAVNHIPQTSAVGATYKEAGVAIGSFTTDGWVTVTVTLNTATDLYTCSATDGTTTISDGKEYICRNTSRGLSGYTGLPMYADILLMKNNQNMRIDIDNVKVSAVGFESYVSADADALVVPSAPGKSFTLPLTGGVNGSSISWSCDSSAVSIDSEGNVTVTPQATAQNAVLKATLTMGNCTSTKEFTIALPTDGSVRTVLYEPFDYTPGTVIATKASTTMPWKRDIGNATLAEGCSQYSAYIGGDSTNTYMVQKVDADIDTSSDAHSNHKRAILPFGETLDGIVNYSFKVYMPSDVTDDSGNTYNSTTTGTHNYWLSVTESGGGYEMVSFVARAAGNKVTVYHVPRTSEPDAAYAEGGVYASGTFKTDAWIKFDVEMDVSEYSYTYTVTDGTNTYTAPDKYYFRNLGKYASFKGTPNGLRYFQEKKQKNSLGYVDDINITLKEYSYAVKEDMEKISVPDIPLKSFSLPVSGEKWNSTISWSSDSPALAVDANGNASVVPQAEDAAVTLTATVTKGSYTGTFDYELTVKNKEYIAQQQIDLVLSDLEFKDISGMKEYYLDGDFTPSVENLPEGISASFSVADESIIKLEDGIAKLVTAEADRTTDFTVTLTDADGRKGSKTFNVMVPGNGITILNQGFDDESMKDKPVSTMDGFSVQSENSDTSVTGTTSTLRYEDGDGYLDTQRYRPYGSNQYAIYSCSAGVSEDTVIQARMKFTGSEKYWYILYFNGDFTDENGKTVASNSGFSQLSFDNINTMHPGGIHGPTPDSTFDSLYAGDLPFGEWFNFRMIIHSSDNNYDLYVNDKKLTDAPVKMYNEFDGNLTKIRNIYIGASRNKEFSGNFYIDDITVRALGSDDYFLDKAKENVSLTGEQIMFDLDLPTTGDFDSTIEWASSNPSIISADGVVSRAPGFGSDKVTLTATLKRNAAQTTKAFDLEVLRKPYYDVYSLSFADSEGKASYTPSAGGKITGISLSENTPVAAAKLFVAIYDGDELCSAEILVPADGTQELDIDIPAGISPVVKVFVWDMQENNMLPLSHVYSASGDASENEKITLYMIGDSTMATVSKGADADLNKSQAGWGEVVHTLFDSNYVTVENHAVGGRSSRSFYDEGRLQTVLEKIQPGDYMIIQFGHNDQKPEEAEKYTTLGEDGTYRRYLMKYIDAAKSKGAYPVLATSIYRRRFDSAGNSVNSQCGYPEDMIEFAAAAGVPLLDMHARTGEWLTKLGVDGSLKYFMVYANGSDNTHMTYPGALEIVNIAKGEMERIGLPLVKYFK